MKIAVLLKSGPFTAEAHRALQTAADLLSEDHAVHLYLLQDAVNFCQTDVKDDASRGMNCFLDEKLNVHVLVQDAALRGIDVDSAGRPVAGGDYDSLADLVTTSDRVIGLL